MPNIKAWRMAMASAVPARTFASSNAWKAFGVIRELRSEAFVVRWLFGFEDWDWDN